MTVATGVGGTTVAGAVLGVALTRPAAETVVPAATFTGPFTAGPAAESVAVASGRQDAIGAQDVLVAAGEGARTLPFTGANEVVLMLVIALVLLVAGMLMLGLSRRHDSAAVASPPA